MSTSKPPLKPAVTTIGLSESFSLLLKTKPVAKTKRLMLHAIPGDHSARFGILVPKRFAKRAVDRNTLKRIIRHACRESLVNYRGTALVRLTKPVSQIPDSDRSAWWTELQLLLACPSLRDQSAS